MSKTQIRKECKEQRERIRNVILSLTDNTINLSFAINELHYLIEQSYDIQNLCIKTIQSAEDEKIVTRLMKRAGVGDVPKDYDYIDAKENEE